MNIVSNPVRPSLQQLRTRLGRNLHALRQRRAMSLEKLARLSGIPANRIDRIEIGGGEMSLHDIARLAYALRACPDAILHGQDREDTIRVFAPDTIE